MSHILVNFTYVGRVIKENGGGDEFKYDVFDIL
jgi:hypothetical protein